MKIALHDAENEHFKKKTFPNYALMKLSTYHKARGDEVKWWIAGNEYDKVYSSKVFDFTAANPLLPKDTIRGGTGYKDLPIDQKLPDEVDSCYPDYSIYPNCDYAIGYLTRGCIRNCPWCVVPAKEGGIKPYNRWQDVVRRDTQKLTLLDNNILACEHGIEQLAELSETKYKLDLNQGMDARLVTAEVAKILAGIRWQRFIRFSCDRKEQLESVERTIDLLGSFGAKPYKIFIYLLVCKDVDDAAFRAERLKKYKSINLYAQPERNAALGIIPNKEQKDFSARYLYGGLYRKETWAEYKERHSLIYLEK